MSFTDLHSHIAWGVDDGCRTEEETRQALERAGQSGISTIVSTPHITPGKTSLQEYRQIQKRQEELISLAREHGIQVLCAGEIMINYDFLDVLKQDWYPVYPGTRMMLVEFNVRSDYHTYEYPWDPVQELAAAGLTPVLAHVERYFHGKPDYEVLDEWREAGAVFQINGTSLTGKDTPQSRKNAWELLENGYGDLVVSDAHSPLGSRQEELQSAWDLVSKKFGEDYARRIFHENPQAVLKGKVPRPAVPQKQSIFRKLFRKEPR